MIEGKRILAVTLARGGSKKIPRKNIKLINNVPLLVYTIKQAQLSKYIDTYVISTEDPEIASVAHKYLVEIHNRPIELAQDTSTSASVIFNVLETYKDFDVIVELMATNPFKTASDIDKAIEKLINTDADSVVGVSRVYDHHPARLKYIENDRLCDFYPEIPESRRQDLEPAAYVRNGSIYAFTKESFLRNGSRIGQNCHPLIMNEDKSINIDDPNDFLLAQILLKPKVTEDNYLQMFDAH
jgi:CMP-N,N'-diacetyllegionaminic acid synthase